MVRLFHDIEKSPPTQSGAISRLVRLHLGIKKFPFTLLNFIPASFKSETSFKYTSPATSNNESVCQ